MLPAAPVAVTIRRGSAMSGALYSPMGGLRSRGSRVSPSRIRCPSQCDPGTQSQQAVSSACDLQHTRPVLGVTFGALGSYSETCRALSFAPPGGTESEKPAPASSHIDEAVPHDHAHSAGGRDGRHSHDHGGSLGRTPAGARSDGGPSSRNCSVPSVRFRPWRPTRNMVGCPGPGSSPHRGTPDAPPTRREAHVGWARLILAAALQAGMPSLSASWSGAWRLAFPPPVEAGPMLLVGISACSRTSSHC